MTALIIILVLVLVAAAVILAENVALADQVFVLTMKLDDAYREGDALRAEANYLRTEVTVADDAAFETAMALANEQRLHERDVVTLHDELEATEDQLAAARKKRTRKAASAK